MSKKDIEVKEGIVMEALPNAMFKVKLDDTEDEILSYVSGKMRLYHIKILPGDRVRLEMTKYDSGKGRIVFRIG